MPQKYLTLICLTISVALFGCSGEEQKQTASQQSTQAVSGQDINNILAQKENMTAEELDKLGESPDDQSEQGNTGSLEEVNNAIANTTSDTSDDAGSASSPDESRSLEPGPEPVVEEATSQATADSSLEESAVEPDTPTPPSAEILQKARQVTQLNSEAIKKIQSGDKSAYQDFKQAAKIAREVIEANEIFAQQGARILSMVFYNEACALSLDEDVEGAIASLELCFDYGGMDLDQLSQDADLENVRADAGFAAKLEAWQAKASEAAIAEAKEALADGESFPFAFEFTSIQDGKTISLESLKGKVVIVDIWGTWCPPCRAEIPSFVKLQETYGKDGFQIVGLNYEGNGEPAQYEQTVKDFIAEFGINYPCMFGDEATRTQVPNFSGYPTTIFIDREGKVRLKVVGLHEYSFLESIVKELLKS